MPNIKIALFTVNPRSLISIIIATVTGQPFTHAAFCVEGVWYDASESRGRFAPLDPKKYKNRFCLIADLPNNFHQPIFYQRLIKKMLNVEYDYSGVLGWIFGFNGSGKKFYCFEAVLIFLANHFSDGPFIVNFPHHVSGGDVFNYKSLSWTTQKGLS